MHLVHMIYDALDSSGTSSPVRYIDIDISPFLKNIDIVMVISENIDIDIDIDKAILENINIKIDIDKAILKISISISISIGSL